ncbi:MULTISPECIES: threonine synthase [Halolamina]|uniref:Threonine synthase n=1 Tax=Halolamina pelagica TaxID=699431 RepID=A0A1I5MBT8_9EURY|nr:MULTISPECIES: threonine synthase [Halolamina]NHX35935.1 threonine synthase [Halolamina sp. R1-12]SFP06416.1 threonine synthase [Halolamina pelagica]
METTDAFVGLDCIDCGERFDAGTATHRCPDCGGILDPAYDYDAVDVTREAFENEPFDSLWRYDALLPFPRESAVSLGEGATPLVECPTLADAMGVGEVYIKDEGHNPTGTFKDRGQTGAVTAAAQHGADTIALNTAGNAGQAAAAYAARTGMDSHVWMAERAGYTQKAMVEVHGGELHVVEGEITDAGAGYAERMAQEDWYSTKTFVTPYRHETKKTMLYETVEQLDWKVPDAVVYPTGGGVGLVGMHKGAKEFRDLDLIDDLPGMYAAQAAGCAPVVKAWEEGKSIHEAWGDENISTVLNGIAVPDPGASPMILDALEESGGGAVAASDEAILDAAVEIARTEGVEMGATCAAAAAGAFDLAESGDLGADDTVVLLNTGAGNKDVDTLRSHLGEREFESGK